MNKNSVIGIILIIGILVGWSIWMTPSKEEIARQREYQDSIYRANRERYIQDSIRFVEAQQAAEQHEVTRLGNNELSDAVMRDKYGVFATTATGEEQLYTIENDVMKMTLTSKGAFVKTVELKDYKTWDSLALISFDENTTKFNLSFFASNRNINTIDLLLGDVRVDPDTDVKAPFVKLRDKAGRVGEHVAVPEEIAPVAVLHPEAVEVEDRQVDAALFHSVNKRQHGLFIVIGRERG